MKKVFILLFICLLTSLMYGRSGEKATVESCNCQENRVYVNTVEELQTQLITSKLAIHADKEYIIEVANNIYETTGTEQIIITLERNRDCKLRVIGESKENVIFRGAIFFRFYTNARNISMENITFNRTNILPNYAKSIVDFSSSKDCSIINCDFIEYENNHPESNTYYIRISNGAHNEVKNCSFNRKYSSGYMIDIEISEQEYVDNQHKILNNYFGPYLFTGKSSYIKIGSCGIDSKENSWVNSEIEVSDNFFEGYSTITGIAGTEDENDPQTRYWELISNKTSGNIYRRNTFFNCNGALTIRCGANCIIEENRFIGPLPEEDNFYITTNNFNYGISIQGPEHVVLNNYFERLQSNPIRISGGDGDFVYDPDPSLIRPDYANSDNLVIAFNSLYNCDRSIHYTFSSKSSIMPKDNIFSNNLIYNPEFMGAAFIITDNTSTQTSNWSTNEFNKNIHFSNNMKPFTIPSFPVTTTAGNPHIDPLIIYNGAEYIPNAFDSPARDNSYQGGLSIYTNHDINQLDRDLILKDIGCHEVFTSINSPSNGESGLSPRNSATLKINPNPFSDQINIYDAKLGETVIFYNIQGQKIKEKEIDSPHTIIETIDLKKGTYFMNYLNKTIRIVKQ